MFPHRNRSIHISYYCYFLKFTALLLLFFHCSAMLHHSEYRRKRVASTSCVLLIRFMSSMCICEKMWDRNCKYVVRQLRQRLSRTEIQNYKMSSRNVEAMVYRLKCFFLLLWEDERREVKGLNRSIFPIDHCSHN